jgi:arsenate reductase
MKRRVLIICTGNSCRSQMAEGLLRDMRKGDIEVESAGTHPSRVHPMAIKVMEEAGIDISHHTSKSVRVFENQKFDYVITVCDHAKAVCPAFPGARKLLHMPIEDPVSMFGDEEMRLDKFRSVRDTIRKRLELFMLEEMK